MYTSIFDFYVSYLDLYLEDKFWDVIVYPTPVELVGGAADGELVSPGFSLNLQELWSSFDEVTDVNWRAFDFGPHDPDGPHISIEGVYQGHNVDQHLSEGMSFYERK